ncbi:hypothetical protein NDU88_010499, partial [Pleurodeles waltl]
IPHASFVSLNPICVPFLCHVPDPLCSYVLSCRALTIPDEALKHLTTRCMLHRNP